MSTNSEENSNSENKNLTHREPSKDFFNLVEVLAQSFEKPKEVYKKLVDKGREEKFTDEEINMLINSYLKGRIARSTLSDYRKEFLELPSPTKNPSPTNLSGSGHIDDKKVPEDSSIDNLSLELEAKINETNETLAKNNINSLKLYERLIDTGFNKEEAQQKSGYISKQELSNMIDKAVTEEEQSPVSKQQQSYHESPALKEFRETKGTIEHPTEQTIVTIKLGMNDCKDIKNVVNRINLLHGFSFEYNLQTQKIMTIQTK